MKENENKEQSKTAGAARQGGDTNNKVMGSAVSTAVGEPVATAGHLTDERIEQVAKEAHAAGLLSWLGFEKDGAGKYTVPVLSKYHYQFARAVEREVVARLAAPTQVSAPQASAAQEVRAVPEGWKLVPSTVTREMQDAYFKVIDKNMQRVTTDPRFGRWDSMREAYAAMIAAAPNTLTSTSTAPAAMDEVRDVIADLAGIVRVQNGNLHADINELLARAEKALKATATQSQPSLDEVTGAGKGEVDA